MKALAAEFSGWRRKIPLLYLQKSFNPISEISLEGDAPSSPELRNFGSDILTFAGINLNLLGGKLGGSWCLGERGLGNGVGA
jgi:hypothetical protein